MVSSSWKSGLAGVATCYLNNQSLWWTVLHLMVCKQAAVLDAEAVGNVSKAKVMTPLFLSLCLEHALHDETKFTDMSWYLKGYSFPRTRATMPNPESHVMIWLSVNWRGQEQTKCLLELHRCTSHSWPCKGAIWVSNTKGALQGRCRWSSTSQI